MKKVLTFIMAAILLIGLPSTVYAAEDSAYAAEDSSGDYELDAAYILYTMCSLDISGGGQAYCSASMLCTAAITKTRISAYLQQYDGGWETVRSWSSDVYSNYIPWSGSYYVSSGHYYRLICYYYAYIGDSIVDNSTLISYEDY